MSDPMIFVLLLVTVLVVIGGIIAIFAVVSNRNKKCVETLEEANNRLTEMREEYSTLHRKKELEQLQHEKYDYE